MNTRQSQESRKVVPSFVGDVLSFLKLGSVLIGFNGRALILFLKANIAKFVFMKSGVSFGLQTGIEVVPGQIHIESHLFCVLMM